MAGGKRKSTSGRGRGTGKRSTSSGRKGSRSNKREESGGIDFTTVVVLLIAVVLVVVLVSKYTKDQKDKNKETPAGVTELTGTPAPEDSVGGPEDREEGPEDITGDPEATKPPMTKPTAAPTPEPTPTEVPDLTLAEAKKRVADIVELDAYSIELLDDHMMLDGYEYFSFCINDANGESIPPLLIVEKKTGEIFCYDDTGASYVERFPLDKTEAGGSTETTLSVEKAKEMLGKYSGEALGLDKPASSYNMSADEWTTIVEGIECYGINLTETAGGKERFRGTFYVAMDGSAVYSMDDATGEFIKR